MARNESLIKRFLQWRLFFVVNLVVIALLGFTLGREYLKTRDIQKQIDGLQAQADELTSKNLSMTELSTAIQTQSFIEREARLKLGMKKPGENVVIFTDEATTDGSPIPNEGETMDPLGLVLDGTEQPHVANSTKWWYYFFDRKMFEKLKTYGD